MTRYLEEWDKDKDKVEIREHRPERDMTLWGLVMVLHEGLEDDHLIPLVDSDRMILFRGVWNVLR
jgi:hypothetical protein